MMEIVQIDRFEAEVKEAMKNGFTFACAMCFRLHVAKARSVGKGWNVSCGETRCGGPGTGMAYPRYDGPLGDNLVSHCVYCGTKDPGKAVSVKGEHNRILGVCDEHMTYLKKGWSAKPQGSAEPKKPQGIIVKG